MKPTPYVNQCDRLRRNCVRGEEFWQAMMRAREPISRMMFLRAVGTVPFLDEGETLDDFMAGDPEAGTYRALVWNQPVYFVQVAGFEFIFAGTEIQRMLGCSKRA